jgi:hypothetical protein
LVTKLPASFLLTGPNGVRTEPFQGHPRLRGLASAGERERASSSANPEVGVPERSPDQQRGRPIHEVPAQRARRDHGGAARSRRLLRASTSGKLATLDDYSAYVGLCVDVKRYARLHPGGYTCW